MGLLLGEAGGGLRGDLVQAAEPVLGKPVEIGGRDPLLGPDARELTPHRLAGDTVDGEHLVE
jgi:hypothetical protein